MSTVKSWIRLPLELLKRDDITKSDALLLGVLIDQLQEREEMQAAISQEKLGKLCGVSLSTIKRAENHLELLGLISKQHTGRQTIYKLKGAGELLPPKRRSASDDQPPRPTRRKSQRGKHVDEEKMQAYLSLVNRFPKEVMEDET